MCWKIPMYIIVAFVSCHNMNFYDNKNKKAFYSLIHGRSNHKYAWYLMNVEMIYIEEFREKKMKIASW